MQLVSVDIALKDLQNDIAISLGCVLAIYCFKNKHKTLEKWVVSYCRLFSTLLIGLAMLAIIFYWNL